MSTILNTNGDHLEIPALNKKTNGNFYIVTADWNSDITYSLRDGALQVLREAGVAESKIKCISVPGTVELVNACALVAHSGNAAAVIAIGCKIYGSPLLLRVPLCASFAKRNAFSIISTFFRWLLST